jgi:hypothetical protein
MGIRRTLYGQTTLTGADRPQDPETDERPDDTNED